MTRRDGTRASQPLPGRPARLARIVAASALASALGGIGCATDDDLRVAASVNGERISFGDLARHEAFRLIETQDAAAGVGPWQEQLHRLTALRGLIDQRLLLQRADAQGLVVADRDIESAMDRYRVAYATAEAFRESLHGLGLEADDLRTELRRQLTLEMLLNREISSTVTVNEREMKDYYESNLAAFSVPEQQLHLAQILVSETAVSPIPNVRNDDAVGSEAARQKILRIGEQLEEGADFEQMALHYSEDPIYASNGGDMGFIPQSALEKADTALRRAVASLEPGQLSEIVETGGEFRILHLIAVEQAGQRSFDDLDVQESIREVLFNRKEQLLRLAFYEVERSKASVRNVLAERILSGPSVGH